jgi:preprotein translocase subunit SecY
MLFCPNPECPHRKRTGKPAEFVEETTHCADCGSRLTEKVAEKSDAPKFAISDFQKKIFYTLGLVVLWRILALIPAPGIDVEALGQFLTQRGGAVLGIPEMFFRVSIFALGIMPYISAYIIVEVLALFVKPLKSWREGGYQGRTKLKKTALVATVLVGLMQGYGIAAGIESMNDGRFIHNAGLSFHLILALTLTTGTFITIWIAELITENGIGHGISVLIVTGIAAGFFQQVPSLFSKIDGEIYEHSPFEIFLLVVVLGIALIALVVFAEKSHRRISVKFDDGKEAYMPLKLTTAGVVPASWASSLVLYPALIAGFWDNQVLLKIASALSPGKLAYSFVYAIVMIFLYYLFTALFYKPEKMIVFLKNKNAYISLPSGEESGKYIDRSLETMAFFGSLYLCLLVFMSEVSIRVLGLPIFIGGVGLIESVAIALDLSGESAVRRKSGNIVKVAEFHDVPKAGLCKSLLEGQGIQCHLRGYYYRALFYFFGPYIEISALVPEEKADEAAALIRDYIN